MMLLLRHVAFIVFDPDFLSGTFFRCLAQNNLPHAVPGILSGRKRPVLCPASQHTGSRLLLHVIIYPGQDELVHVLNLVLRPDQLSRDLLQRPMRMTDLE